MCTLRHIAKLFSAAPSALRAGLLGFGLAFAATDPNLAAVGKAATPVVQADLHTGATQALVALDRVAEHTTR